MKMATCAVKSWGTWAPMLLKLKIPAANSGLEIGPFYQQEPDMEKSLKLVCL